MNNTKAHSLLQSPNPHQRLKAARFFEKNVTSKDRTLLKDALRKESVGWVLKSLQKSINFLEAEDQSKPMYPPEELFSDELSQKEIWAKAINEITGKFLHELEAPLGRAILYASQEINDYENSKTKEQLEFLDRILESMSTLHTATKTAVISEFDLSELIKTIVSNFGDSEIEIQKYGPTPLVIKSAASSVQTALNNALKNAIEASKTLPMHSRQPILVTWGVTDLDYWFAVADRGPGLPDGKIENLFKLGQSTKPGHPGAGLEISALSAQALNGKISLSNREGGGATFICRWEKKNR